MALAGFGPEIGHLPEQPLIDRDPAAFVGRIELAGLAPEILQDRTGLEDGDATAARAVRIDDRRHAVVGRYFQKVRLELLTLGDVDRDDPVGEPALLQHDRNLPAIGRRPVMEVDGGDASFPDRWRPPRLSP